MTSLHWPTSGLWRTFTLIPYWMCSTVRIPTVHFWLPQPKSWWFPRSQQDGHLLTWANSGVWDTDTAQTLYFFIDVKTSGHETFQAVIEALEPLRKKGYLTTLKGGKTVENGPVTIIGTGETPLDMVLPVKDRDYFFDAPLASLSQAKYAKVDHTISPIASTNFVAAVGQVTFDTEPVLRDDQLKALRAQISLAKQRGIGARYWNTPNWPVRQRNLVWRTLLQEGVGLLNADDLDAVTSFFWGLLSRISHLRIPPVPSDRFHASFQWK